MFRFLTSGESHGPALIATLEGIPANMPCDFDAIDAQLLRRQGGYGRGARMRIEHDHVEVLAGVRHGKTLGSPITLSIANKDWENWRERMASAPVAAPPEPITKVRPGHADFTGALKYGQDDIRNVIERSSSRETAARVAVGAVCRQLLAQFGIAIHSQVTAIGPIAATTQPDLGPAGWPDELWERVEASPVHCGDPELAERMIAHIDAIRSSGDTAGGVFEVVAMGVPIGLGSYAQWDRRLGARLGMAMLSIPATKGMEIGGGFAVAALPGSQVHDVLRHDGAGGWSHLSNNAGGLEGGITNGEPLVVRVALKPIPTLARPLPSVDLATNENIEATRYERSDVCVVPAGGVVGEAMMAIVLAEAMLEKYGGDNLEEMRRHFEGSQALMDRHDGPAPAAD